MNIRIIPFERLIEQDKNARGVFSKKWEVCVECNSLEEAEKLKTTLAQPEQEPVLDGLPLVIAGAIFDFAGYLTTRDKVIKIGSTANASPMVELIKEWAALRGLSLNDAAVLSWQELLYTTPPQRKPLTEREILDLLPDAQHGWTTAFYGKWVARAVERAHGIKGE